MWDTVAIGHITDAIHVKKQGIDMSWFLDGNNRHTFGGYNALSMGKKTPKIATSPWDFVTSLEEDRTTVIGNMHIKY